jgi:RNA polymerase sigma-70 factor (ECF subfamily)
LAVSIRELEDDATLVAAVQGGDAEAFAELFRRHYPGVRRACARRLRDMAEADEMAQAAFVRAYERIDRCGGERRFGAWVQVIAQRLCIDSMRARARTTPQEEPIRGDRAIGPNGPEENLLRRQRAADVHVALASLPPRQRSVVIARDIEERRPGEIAAALGLSIGAVDSLLLRARRRLASVYRATSEQGVASAASSSAVATTALAAGRGPILRFVASAMSELRDTLAELSIHAGLAPGAGETHRAVASAAVAAVMAVTGMAASQPAGETPPVAKVVALAPPAPAVPAPPPAPDAPRVPGSISEAFNSVSLPTLPSVSTPHPGDARDQLSRTSTGVLEQVVQPATKTAVASATVTVNKLVDMLVGTVAEVTSTLTTRSK